MNSKPITKPTTRRSQRQTEILGVARDVLLRDGFANFTMRDVAQMADMSLGNLQYYYPSRNDLVAGVVEDEIETSFAILDHVNWTASSPETVLMTLTHTLLKRLGGPGGKLFLMMAFLALHEERFRILVDDTYDKLFPMVKIALGQLKPEATPNEAETLSEIIVALFDGAGARIHAQPNRFDDATLYAYAENMTKAMLRIIDIPSTD